MYVKDVYSKQWTEMGNDKVCRADSNDTWSIYSRISDQLVTLEFDANCRAKYSIRLKRICHGAERARYYFAEW